MSLTSGSEACPEDMASSMSFADTAREQVVAWAPFTVRRVARWSECDPAGVVYSGIFTEYLLSAVHLYRRSVFGRDWARVRSDLHVDLPGKAVSLVFEGSLWPDDVFDISVFVGDVRTRTFDYLAEAVRSESTDPIFRGRFSVISVSADDRKVSVPLPAELRERLRKAAARSPAPTHLHTLVG